MPAPGDQHSGIANPFEEAKPRISEFTAVEIATLQSRLEKQLGPEYLSSRSGPSGQKVHYIAAEKCIALANEVFGFNGWSSSIQNIQVDFVDENPQTLKISLGLSVIVRVTLRDGTFHEDIGYGHIENCKGKAAAFEKAKKEGTTDALKRALRNFGNVLGNCIYDKDYLSKVTKIKVAPTRFDEDNLHRHSDYIKKEPEAAKVDTRKQIEAKAVEKAGAHALSDMLDEEFGDFDMVDFGVTEDGHPDEVVLPASHDQGTNSNSTHSNDRSQPVPVGSRSSTNSAAPRPMQPPVSRPTAQPPRPPQTPNQPAQRPGPQFQGRPNPQQQQPPRPPSHASNTAQQAAAAAATANRSNTPPINAAAANPPNGGSGAPSEPVAFFSARSVKDIPEDAPPGTASINPQAAKIFDPHADSPSIRKTPGIDHRTSKPVGRNGQHVPPITAGGGAGNNNKGGDGPPQPQPPLAQPRLLPPHNNAAAAASGPGRPPAAAMNPALGHARQIGAPAGSPLGNRGQYRPLTMKRPAPSNNNNNNGPSSDAGGSGSSRAPLTEVSTNGPGAAGGGGGGTGTGTGMGMGTGMGTDAKRQKMA
ncbi:hypothetical protein F5X96DRAFT_637267 [Biscogniauxia mediterranea]|nr:hypothetical protein F5X96DRAFT_637267 [Biscogniauxia mediterranea]